MTTLSALEAQLEAEYIRASRIQLMHTPDTPEWRYNQGAIEVLEQIMYVHKPDAKWTYNLCIREGLIDIGRCCHRHPDVGAEYACKSCTDGQCSDCTLLKPEAVR